MMVADASLLVKVLTLEDGTAEARIALVDADRVLAPDLVLLEVASALSKKVRYHGLPRDQAIMAFQAAPRFVDVMEPGDRFIAEAFDLSLMLAHALQDCIYLALAIERRCKLLTCDRKFAAKVMASPLADRIAML